MANITENLAKATFQEAIAQGLLPRYLYKYTTVENCLRMINDGTIYFADYHTFNDPFECKAIIDTKNTEEEWCQYLINNGVNVLVAARLAHLVASDPVKAEQEVKRIVLENQDTTGFLCLSRKNDNLLLWAHYTNQHEGCCVKLDLLNDVDLFYRIRAVVYDDNYLSYNYLRNHKGAFDTICHKSKAWEYEEEYRILSFNQIGAKPIKPGTVKEIYLGCRIKDDDKRRVIDVVSRTVKQPGIILYQATTDDKSYKLNFTRL